jgi:energy-coupling factor transporter ATP-binding protein EcfA2
MEPPLMQENVHRRTLIIGNSGAGKTTLGGQIAGIVGGRHIALDDIYWEGAAGLKKRVEPAAKQLTSAAADEPCWVIEGVFGWLVDVAVPRATALIWLDLPWDECKAGLEARGPGYSPSPAEYAALVQWASEYGTRQTASSEAGHRKIFDAFSSSKIALRNRCEIDAFVARLRRAETAVEET